MCMHAENVHIPIDFPVVKFPFLSGIIPATALYGVYMSQLIRYAGARSTYQEFLGRAKLLTSKLLKQDYLPPRLRSNFKYVYGRHHTLIALTTMANRSRI